MAEEDDVSSKEVRMSERGVGQSIPEEKELVSIPVTPHAARSQAPTPGMASPGFFSPKPPKTPGGRSGFMSPRSFRIGSGFMSPRFMSPIGTPVRRAFTNMKGYLEDLGHITKINPQDAWLPVTETRKGNAYYSAFHTLNSGIGFQALILPVALSYLGWIGGVVSLVLGYIWQLYTLRLLIELHEGVPGKRFSRYTELAQEAFGKRLGNWLTMLPIMNLSGGTATSLIIFGGSALKLFFTIVCTDCHGKGLTTVEWYLVFTVLCAIIVHLPNLHSVAFVSLLGAVMAVAYITLIWGLSISVPRPAGVTYHKITRSSGVDNFFALMNALGVVAFSFRGHNLVLEIQATMTSTLKNPSKIPMWKGTKWAYVVISACYFPVSIAGYWAYGSMTLSSGSLFSLYAFHSHDIAKGWMGLTFLLVVLHCVSSFQIYSMPVFDMFEQGVTASSNKPISKPVRFIFRVAFVFFDFFIACAIPFINSFAGFLGGLSSIPVTFCYPCFMWLFLKKPDKYSFSWCLNWFLGIVGAILSVLLTAGGIWSIVDSGLTLNFFHPT